MAGYRVGSPVYLINRIGERCRGFGVLKDLLKQETREYLCFEEDKCNMYGITAFTTP
jgi:hypothetical protein